LHEGYDNSVKLSNVKGVTALLAQGVDFVKKQDTRDIRREAE
jgi:hypothetical protein